MSYSESLSKREDQKGEDSWKIEEPDEAKYNFSEEKGVWQPKPEDILSLFEKLAKGDPLPLKWTCPGRRPPQKDVKSEDNMEEGMDVDEDESKDEESKVPEISAFDFDEPHIDVNAKLTPRRAPGGTGRTPRTEKRVARMDNIMKSLQKQQLQRVAEREARKTKGSPSGTPPGRSRLLNFGSPGPKHTSTGATSASVSPSSGSSPSRANSKTAASAFDFVSHSSGKNPSPGQPAASTSKDPVVSSPVNDTSPGGVQSAAVSAVVVTSDQQASATNTVAPSILMSTMQKAEDSAISSSDSINQTTGFTSGAPMASTTAISSAPSILPTPHTDPIPVSTSSSVPADKDPLPVTVSPLTVAAVTTATTAPPNQPQLVSISSSKSDENFAPSTTESPIPPAPAELSVQPTSTPNDVKESSKPLVADAADQDRPSMDGEAVTVPTTKSDQSPSQAQDTTKPSDNVKTDESSSSNP